MKHWFIDTNILLDYLLNRPVFADAAETLFRLVMARQVTLYISSLSLANAHYVMRRQLPAPVVIDALHQVRPLLRIVALDEAAIDQALAASMPDFEDALQYFCAIAVPGVTAIVTRDPRGFAESRLEVLAPTDAVRRLR
ncbi:MAG: PIN domain-containing protein [Hymenobacteraceae bacterium]|nr:PIN domain-containing protein [Hymenobacteraceae bacterium]